MSIQDAAVSIGTASGTMSSRFETGAMGGLQGAQDMGWTTEGVRTSVECLFAVSMMLAISPLLLALAVLVRLSSRGPILFTQTRVGKSGAKFPIYKFRTMVANAEDATGPTLSWQGDPRVTQLGRWMRASHLDELPQLINIARGDMSFIGPRPERPEFTEQFRQEIAAYRSRELVKPGVTGLAQVMAPYDALAADKLTYDLEYIRKRTLWMDVKILLFTALSLVGLRRQWSLS